MANEEQITQLAAAIADDARSAFTQLLKNIGDESPYGFALYTDDAATGLDVAINTRESYANQIAAPRVDAFAAYWYPSEWSFEGGVAESFETTSDRLEELAPNADDDSLYDEFRELVFNAMLRGLKILVQSGYFAPYLTSGDSFFQIAVSDSEDGDRLMALSIRTLNPPAVYDAFLQQKADSGD